MTAATKKVASGPCPDTIINPMAEKKTMQQPAGTPMSVRGKKHVRKALCREAPRLRAAFERAGSTAAAKELVHRIISGKRINAAATAGGTRPWTVARTFAANPWGNNAIIF